MREKPADTLSRFQVMERIGDYFQGSSTVHKALGNIAEALGKAGVDYALLGALAMYLHGYKRETLDVDIVVRPQDLSVIEDELVGRGFVHPPGASRTLKDASTKVAIDIVRTGDYPGDGKKKPVSFPDPNEAVILSGFKVLPLERIVELKLASGMTAPHRMKDLADVQELIKAKNLGAAYADGLNPYVRGKYLELWRSVQGAEE